MSSGSIIWVMLKESAVSILAPVVRQMIAGSNPLGLECTHPFPVPAGSSEAEQACVQILDLLNVSRRRSLWGPRLAEQEVGQLRWALSEAVSGREGFFGLDRLQTRTAIVFCPDSGQSEIVFSFPADMTAEQILARILGEQIPQIPSPEWLTQDI